MKKIIAMIMVVALMMGMTACGTKAESPASNKEETAAPVVQPEVPKAQTDEEIGGYKIGFYYNPDSDGLSRQYRAALNYVAKLTNCEIEVVDIFTWSSDELSAAVETLVTDGCDGVIIIGGGSPAMFDYLNNAGVYYCGLTRSYTDEVALVADDSDYCTGWLNENTGMNFTMGYEMTKALAEQGATKIACVAGAPGISMNDDRALGMETAAKDLGLEIVTSYRGNDPTVGIADILASFGSELDGIVSQALEDQGVAALNAAGLSDSILYSQIDPPTNAKEYFASGRLHGTCAGNNVYILQMYMQLFNAISGADRLFDEGSKLIPMIPNFAVTSLAEYEMTEKYVQGEIPGLLPEELLALCSHYAPDTTVEEKEALMEKYTSAEYWNIDAIAERVGPFVD